MKHKTIAWNGSNSYQCIQEFEPQAIKVVTEVAPNFRQRNAPKIQQITYFAENGNSLAVRVAGEMTSNSVTYRNLMKPFQADIANNTHPDFWVYRRRNE